MKLKLSEQVADFQIARLREEVAALQARWDKLEEWLVDDKDNDLTTICAVMNKMSELEEAEG